MICETNVAMYVTLILVKHQICPVSFQIIIAFLNNINKKSCYNLQNGYCLPIILPNEMFFSYVRSTLIISNVTIVHINKIQKKMLPTILITKSHTDNVDGQ